MKKAGHNQGSNEGNNEGTFDTAMDRQTAHQPWMGALVSMAPPVQRLTAESWLTTARAHVDRPRLVERLWDGVLALVFVAGCAALGWAGAVLL